jgi:hypothetical protein
LSPLVDPSTLRWLIQATRRLAGRKAKVGRPSSS